MSPSFRRVVIAAGLLVFGACPVASAQISLGIGSPAHREAEARILQQLERRDTFVFEDVPLNAFVEAIRKRFGINVNIDRRALEDFGIDAATPVSLHLRDAALESCLNLLLDSFGLAWTIRQESLVITTPEGAETSLETRVYPVRDLVLIELERTVDADFDSLIEMITSAIEPDSWDEVGGPGAIEGDLGSLSLVVSQTWQVHRQIEPLLTTLRAVREMQGIAPVQIQSKPIAAAKPAREYRATAASAWQRPRVYDH